MNYVDIGCNFIIDNITKIKDVVVSLGVILGGWWTYRLFIKHRQIYPRANISHEIFHQRMPNNELYLMVKVIIDNIGNVLICLDSGFTRVNQLLPFCEEVVSSIENYQKEIGREIEWPMLDKKDFSPRETKYEIEPGEKDEVCFEFILQENVEQIMIYSYIKNVKKKSRFWEVFKKSRNIGWSATTICNTKGV